MKRTALALFVSMVAASVHAAEVNAPVMSEVEKAAQGLLVADPQTILKVRGQIGRTSAAKRAPVLDTFDDFAEAPLDLEEVFNVSSDPNSQTPQILLARYMSTSVNFVDAYGKPWPIRRQMSFLSGLVEVVQVVEPAPSTGENGESSTGIDINDPQAGSLNMSSLKNGAAGNITVYLVNRSTPVTLAVSGKSGVYHKEVTVKIDEVGPQTDLKKVNRADEVIVGTKTDSDLNSALYGVGPIGSKAMVVEGGEGRAWIKGAALYLQTPLSVFSPRVMGASHANGRYRAYKLPTTSIVMASNNEGKTVSLKIKRNVATSIYEESQQGSGY